MPMNYPEDLNTLCKIVSDEDLGRILDRFGLGHLKSRGSVIRDALCGKTTAATYLENQAASTSACSCKGTAVATLQSAVQQTCGGGSDSSTSIVPSTSGRPTDLKPGFDNCLPYRGDMAECDIATVKRTKRRYVDVVDTTAGTLVPVTAAIAPELTAPAGFDWFRVEIASVDVSHVSCPKDFILWQDVDTTVAGGFDVDVTSAIAEVAVQSEKIYKNGDGNYVHAWTQPMPADPDDLKNKDGRCWCEELCECVTYFGKTSIVILAPTLGVNGAYQLTIKGNRKTWEINCGPCEPGLQCGREIVV